MIFLLLFPFHTNRVQLILNTIWITFALPKTKGTRTLNAVRSSQYQHDYHSNAPSNNIWHRTSAGRSSGGTTASSKERHQARSNNFLASAVAAAASAHSVENGDNDVDTMSNSSSTDGVRALNYNPDMVLFKAQRDQQSDATAQNSASSSGDSSTSMLVAEHGFVRFRPMENIPKDKKETKPSNSDNNKNSPAIMQRHHKRSLTNS